MPWIEKLYLKKCPFNTLPALKNSLTNCKQIYLDSTLLDTTVNTIFEVPLLEIVSVRSTVFSGIFRISTTIAAAKKLWYLDCSYNSSIIFPNEIAQCNVLQTIILKGCNANDTTIMPLEGCRFLRSVDLRQNRIFHLNNFLSLCNDLETLLVSNNQIATISLTANMWKNVKEIDLSYNKLTTLPPAIALLPSIRSVKVGFNSLDTLMLDPKVLKWLDTYAESNWRLLQQ
jgi:Leucine-rich repeat (LRR) protein